MGELGIYHEASTIFKLPKFPPFNIYASSLVSIRKFSRSFDCWDCIFLFCIVKINI